MRQLAGWLTGVALVLALAGSLPARASTDNPERAALLAEGEAALSHGQTDQALRRFERAASMAHAADTELALVRTYLQAGDYRQAIAFSAHTAGAHRQVVEGAALYAWLLAIGGQVEAAHRLLGEAAERFPSVPLLAAVRRGIDDPADRLDAAGATSVRLAPYSSGPVVPQGAAVVGSAVLIDGGRHALAPLELLGRASQGPQGLQVRNGLGQTAAAHVVRREVALGVALLALTPTLTGRSLPRALGDTAVEVPLPIAAARDPFPGSPGHAVEFAPDAQARPAWPRLRSGFHGSVEGGSGPRALGIELPAGPRGGPVLDVAGQWAGLALRVAGVDRMVPVSALRRVFAAQIEAPREGLPTGSAGRVAVDAVYEGALRMTLQLIAVPGRPR